MISSISWVPAGVADPNPKKYEMSAVEEELVRCMQQKELDASAAPARTKATMSTQLPPVDMSTLPADLRMDEYSSDEEDEGKQAAALGKLLLGQKEQLIQEGMDDDDEEEEEEEESANDDDNNTNGEISDPMEKNEEGVDSEDDEDDDLEDVPDTREFTPLDMEGLEAMGLSHVGLNTDQPDVEDDKSEVEDVELTADDAVILVAKTEEDYPSLEVHVYDQKLGNLYVHHDIPLPAFPLCVAHGQVCGDRTGNFCAVGTFEPGIEIWNLDILNALEPLCVLGGNDTSLTDDLMRMQLTGEAKPTFAARTQKQPASRLKPGSHTDAVMALSWNAVHKQVLASGSADGTVKLWDVTKACDNADNANASTFAHHTNKVQSVAWNPHEGTLLASGSFDRTVALVDARGDGSNTRSFRIVADCEAIAWDPFCSERLTVLTEDGTLATWDVRNLEKPLWSSVVSEFGGVTDAAYNSQVRGLLVTCSTDKSVTLWDVHKEAQPVSCGSKDMCAGKLYSASFYPSAPWLLGCGGAGNMLSLWDLSSEETIQRRFSDRASDAAPVEMQGKEEDFEKMMIGQTNDDVAGLQDRAKQFEGQKRPKDKKKKTGKKKKRSR